MRNVPNLPRMLIEDRIALLRALVVLAWGLLLGLATLELWLRVIGGGWPTQGLFSVTFNAILAAFAVNTVVLTALLLYRDWFERVPRDAEHRVSWLLALVLVWLGLHVFYLFHVSGSLHGPLLPLLPIALIAGLICLPGRDGWWLAAYVLAGHGLVLALEQFAVIHPRGPLAAALGLGNDLLSPGSVTLAAVLGLALVPALHARRWMYPGKAEGHPARRIDATTGLFRRWFLRERLQREMGRGMRQHSDLALVLIRLDSNEAGQGDGPSTLTEAARVLLQTIRLHSDTPARYGLRTVAVVLPAADADGAIAFCRRLDAEWREAGLPSAAIGGAACSPSTTDPEQLVAAAERSLDEAAPGSEPVVARV